MELLRQVVETWDGANPAVNRRSLGALLGSTAALVALQDAGLAKKKKKKNKKTCPTNVQIVCPANDSTCPLTNPWGCGKSCTCQTGTSSTSCVEVPLVCLICTTDADCVAAQGAGAVCASFAGQNCSCQGFPKACMPPCSNPLTTTLS